MNQENIKCNVIFFRVAKASKSKNYHCVALKIHKFMTS